MEVKKDISSYIYIILMFLVFSISTAFGQCPSNTWSLNITINPDQYPEETSWYIVDFSGDTLISGGPYTNIIDYEPQYASACAPIDSFYIVINDLYGDGIAGSLWGGNDGSVYIEQCGDTIWELPVANFGYQIFDTIYTSGCPPPPPVFGCMDTSYVEFNPAATLDTGMCFISKIYGCTDSLAYNYIDSANTDINIDSCMHELELTDLAGNGWAGSSLKISQATSLIPPFNYQDLGTYTLIDGFDTTFFINLAAGYPVRAVFEITQQSDFTAVQCGYSLYSEDYVAIDIEGGFVNPIPPFFPIIGEPYCGNTCVEKIFGCIDTAAINYDTLANTDDGSCYYNPGCMNPLYLEYDTIADYDDGSCVTLVVLGCMDSTALNYDPNANVEIPNSCIAVVYGCMNPLAFNYNPNANVNDTCIAIVEGCTNPIALNYDTLANVDDNSCILPIPGCTDPNAFNYNALANVDDSSCIAIVYGCTDATMFNYNPTANIDNGSCEPFVYGCMDSTMFNFNPLANVDNNSCVPFIFGCTDPSMLNYNPQANTEDFSCIPYIYGCTDSTAINYNPEANTDNGSCVAVVEGCMDQNAYNYNELANIDNPESCLYSAGCVTGDSIPYWLNDPCYAWVIDVDAYCCDNEWDNICQLTYNYCYEGWTGPQPVSRLDYNSLSVYPNPTNSKINISKNVDIDVINYIGDVIISKKNVNVLDVSKMSSGVYMLRINYEDKIINKTIIKN